MSEINGLAVEDLPDGWQPLNVIAITECVDLSDDRAGAAMHRLSTRSTDGLTVWAAIGMLEAAAADLKQQYVEKLEDE
jgi:hypothetical protein